MHHSLSLDQTPPISVPLRFFISAPLFGVLAALMLCFYGSELLQTRWFPATLGVTHLITLGVLTMVMCGALFQMLPVIAGATIHKALPISLITHLLLSIGTLSLVISFITGNSYLFKLAIYALAGAMGLFFIATLYSLLKVPRSQPTVTGIRIAIFGFIVTAGVGLTLAASYAWSGWNAPRDLLTNLHLAWGFLGWISILVIVVAYQVVPMFQMTSEYPAWIRNSLSWALLSTLLLWSIGLISGINTQAILLILGLLLAGALILFAIITLQLQNKRKRKVTDITLSFWRTGMIMLILASLCWVAGQCWPEWQYNPRYPLCLGILFLAGFALSVVNGMLYKIVPFLVWLHLQNKVMANVSLMGTKIPNMQKIIAQHMMQKQFWLYLISLCSLLIALFYPVLLARIAGILFLLNFSWLGWNLLTAVTIYRQEVARLNKLLS